MDNPAQVGPKEW